MIKPIIDPSTLTEEQREIIRQEFDFNADMSARFGNAIASKCHEISQWHQGKCDELISIFGENFFEKGE